MRAVSTILGGLALAVLVVGLALLPLLHPTFTKLVAERYSLSQEAGLPQSRMLSIAEMVREFVVDGDVDTLPATVDGRPGFDEAAVSHLRDVRRVLDAARVFTGVLAAAIAIWIAVEMARGRFATIASAMLAAAAFCVGIVVLGAVAGTMDFEALFTWFHGLFFSAGTWEFPADSLLIQVFPEGFWLTAGEAWAALVLLGGAVLGVGGWMMRTPAQAAPKGTSDRSSVNGA
jgi:integral membrane protein (TIGR01906 family)